MVQEKGRQEILADYHLRVGQLTGDTRLPEGCTLTEQRLDETEVGEGTALTLIDAKQREDWVGSVTPEEVALWLGFDPYSYGECISWDVFDAVLTPGDVILLAAWRDPAASEDFERLAHLPEGARFRRIRVVRDYGMFDRREAPQYYPPVATQGR
jgi:hypothetical protein